MNSLLFLAYELIQKNKYSARKCVWHLSKKARDRCGTVNRNLWSVKKFKECQPSEAFFKKHVMLNFRELTKKASVLKSLFWCFLVNFEKYVRTPFLQNSNGRLLLIIAVSMVAKEVLANETTNYDTKTKAYLLIWARSVSY